MSATTSGAAATPPSAGPEGAGGPVAVAAIDLGATSGRVMLGVVCEGRTELVAARRFENHLAEREGHLSWDVDALWAEIQQGLAEAHDLAVVRGLEGLSSIGIDSWAVDYVLVGPDVPDAAGRVVPGSGARIGEAIAYRDARTDGVADQVAQTVSQQRQFALTGIAQQPFNTLYQLAADDRPAAAPAGTQALLLPDYFGYLLTGQRRTETTNASTTGMFAAGTGDWAPELLAAADVEATLFAPFIDPGERLGSVRPELAAQLGIGEVPVTAVGSHDTASAVLAAPASMDPTDCPVAYISSGTWSLIGLELDSAIATEEARAAGFTNEGGVAGTCRFLKNVAGMWLVSESIRQWREEGREVDLEQLLSEAAKASAHRFRIDPTDPQFLPPGRMADRVLAATRALDGSEARPGSPAELVRCLLESLAETYREELAAACRLAGTQVPQRLHVVGGGSRNALLNQLTADALEIPVIAGPMEATALGNVALQARALGAIPGERGAIRELVRASVELEEFSPSTHRAPDRPAPDHHPTPRQECPMTTPSAAPLTALDSAQAITAGAQGGPLPVLATRAQLTQLPAAIVGAELLATAHGVYEARINGAAVTDTVLDPGWTVYETRLQVQRFDVTTLLRAPEAAEVLLEATLGRGWWNGDFGFGDAAANYGVENALLAALVITFEDGTAQTIVTDESWTATDSPICFATIYDGQREDRRLDPGPPRPVRTAEIDRSTLIEQTSPPIRRYEAIRPQRIWTSPSGRTLIDLGQNLVGWLRFTVTGPAGTEITLRHAEVLEHGELGTRPLRGAEATDRLILAGDPDGEFFEPTFTFHGFRYAEVTGWPGELSAEDLEAVVVHSEMTRSGWFESSHPGVNQLVQNSIWSQRGNFLAVPTDCPQRDERLGWTGDIAAYAATAAFQYEVSDFLHNWLLDLAAEIRLGTAHHVPFVVPDILKYRAGGQDPFSEDAAKEVPTAIWGDAAIWVPEALWNAYGDLDRLRAHYPGMVLHLESVERALSPSGLWDTGWQFADWLDPDASPHDPAAAKADKGVVATACLVRSARFAAETARRIGEEGDAQRWQNLADRTLTAFTQAYVGDDGRIRSDCATVYALAISFDLLDPATRAKAADRLAELVREAGYRVSTGFAGTPFVTWALSETGHVEDAYRLLLEEGNPSWLYPVSMGATTIWERWDSMLPDGSINPGEMTSFNHYALGAVADWIYQVVLGIRPAAPGYAQVRIQPTPGPGIDWVRGAYDSVAGRIEVHWRTSDEGDFSLETTIPEGVPAVIALPDGTEHHVLGGTHRF